MSFYPLANSIGLRSDLNPDGFSSLTCMGILVIGAFVGSSLFTLILLKRKQETFSEIMSLIPRGKLLFLASIAALCHFGGNVLHAILAPVVSVAIATVVGNSYHAWSYIWGLIYGEFSGTSIKTKCILFGGIFLFAAGVVLLSLNSI